MKSDSFVDTNIFIYAAVGAKDEPRKWELSHNVLRTSDTGISGQILAEFYFNCKKKTQLPDREIDDWMDQMSILPCIPVDNALVLEAVVLSRQYQISYWDGAIIAAAERLEARTLYTEDLNHRQTYGSVQAINPFHEH